MSRANAVVQESQSVTATTLIKIFLNGDCAVQNSEVARL